MQRRPRAGIDRRSRMARDHKLLVRRQHPDGNATCRRADPRCVAGGGVGLRVEIDAEPCCVATNLFAQRSAVLADTCREHDRIHAAERRRQRAQLAPDPVDVERDRGLRSRLVTRFERSHVARDAGHAEQARLLVDQLFDRTRVHLELVQQVEHHTRIEIAASRAHWQPIGRGESHRARDAPACVDRTHAGSVAEVQHDDLAGRCAGIVRGQRLRDVFVGQAVEAVADHAAIGQ